MDLSKASSDVAICRTSPRDEVAKVEVEGAEGLLTGEGIPERPRPLCSSDSQA